MLLCSANRRAKTTQWSVPQQGVLSSGQLNTILHLWIWSSSFAVTTLSKALKGYPLGYSAQQSAIVLSVSN